MLATDLRAHADEASVPYHGAASQPPSDLLKKKVSLSAKFTIKVDWHIIVICVYGCA